MRKILITGGAGFAGRRFTKAFLDLGDEVHVVDAVAPLTGGIHPEHGWSLFEPRDYAGFHFHHKDCRLYFKTADGSDFDYCLHLAAVVGGRRMIEEQPLSVADDLAIDSEYWQWAVRTNPRKTICFSSSAAYPVKYQQEADFRLLREDMISFDRELGMPDLSYGWAKLTCEYLAKLAYEKHQLKSVVYRPFSGYGEDQDSEYPFVSICQRALQHRGAGELSVWGSGEQKRDFIHIDDCVRGVMQTMDRIDDAGAVNLSTGIFTSFREFAALAAEVLGYSPRIVGRSAMPSGVFARGGDTSKQRSLGFTATTTLKDGIAAALRHYETVLSRSA